MITKKRISIISETYSPELNGVATTLTYLVSGLLANGHEINVIRPRQNSFEKDGLIDGIHHTFFNRLLIPGYPDLCFGMPAKSKLVKLWRSYPPDIIYVATKGPLGWSAISAANQLDIPVLSGFHSNLYRFSCHHGLGWFSKLMTTYYRIFHNRSLGTLVPTRDMKKQLTNWGIKNVSVVSRGVDCERFSPAHRSDALRQQWGLGHQDTAVLYVGRLAAEKNLPLAISAFKRMHGLNTRSRFILVGDGPLKASLETAHPDFIFAGTQTGQALSEHFASADIFLFPGAFDTFGNVVIEAMASGLGVLAFRHGAAHEHIVDMDNGLTVARQNAEAFVRAGIKLACQPILLKLIRESARNTAYGINWKTVINDFEAQIGFAIRKKKSDLRSRSTVPESNQTSLQQQNKPKVSAHREKRGSILQKG